MKKFTFLSLLLSILLIIAVATGCNDNSGSNKSNETTGGNGQTSPPADNIDIDFTKMNALIASSQLDMVLQDMQSYVGQTMRIRGIYTPDYWELYGIQDIIIECASGCPKLFSFVWTGNHVYPDDYPEIGSLIELTGVFGTFNLEGIEYTLPVITVDEIVIVN
jgi:hypothetical protein